MPPKNQKIIQKRVQRRERFARMARIRHRKQTKALIAKSEILAGIEKSTDNCTSVHHYSPGIFMGERNGGIDCDASMLNKNYLANCISVIEEGDIKLVQIKLCKDASKMRSPPLEVLEDWKKRDNSSWNEWAERFERFSVTYNNFLKKHEEKFTMEKLDTDSVQRYKRFEHFRKELMRTKHCVEIKTRFDLEEDYVSEMTHNSIAINSLEYTVDEFVDKILKEGLPKLKCENDHGFLISKMMDNFETLFEKTLEFAIEWELKLMSKNQIVKTAKHILYVSGYFLKKRAELSYIFVCDDLRSLPENTNLSQPFHIPFIKEDDSLERKAFLEKYYKPQSEGQYCGIREVEHISAGSTPAIVETGDMNTKEEISSNSSVSRHRHSNIDQNNLAYNNSLNSQSNIKAENMQTSDNRQGFRLVSRPQQSYDMILQSYRFLLQNNLFRNNNNNNN